MAKDKFHELYPDYELIPEKSSKIFKLAIRLLAIVGFAGAVVVTYGVLQKLGQADLPVPSITGINHLSVATAKNMAVQQFEAGQFSAAASSFKKYFAWGGDDPQAMDLYAKTLAALGLNTEAHIWDQKAKAKVKALSNQ